MKLRFTRRAQRHIQRIAEYLVERNPDAARYVGGRIRETVELLAAFPDIGHDGRPGGDT